MGFTPGAGPWTPKVRGRSALGMQLFTGPCQMYRLD